MKIKPHSPRNVIQLDGEVIPIDPKLLMSAEKYTACLFFMPKGLSIASMQKAYPEMFGDMNGLVSSIFNMRSNDGKSWNWFAVSKYSSPKSQRVMLLIEAVYAHLTYYLEMGENFFKSKNVVCYADHGEASAVTISFDDDGVMSFPACNFSGKDDYTVGWMLGGKSK